MRAKHRIEYSELVENSGGRPTGQNCESRIVRWPQLLRARILVLVVADPSLDQLLPDPAHVFDTVLKQGRLPPMVEAMFELVATPMDDGWTSIRPGDLIVRRALGEGRLASARTVEAGEDEGLASLDQIVLRTRSHNSADTVDVASEAVVTDLHCVSSRNLRLNADVATAMVETWNRSGEQQSVSGLCGEQLATCPRPHAWMHPQNNAAHFTDLSRLGARVVELAGLWGRDLRGSGNQTRRAAVAVKTRPASLLGGISFVGIRTRQTREVHFGKDTIYRSLDARSVQRVESWVGGQLWKNAGFEMRPDTHYRVFKRRFWEASAHRQWGRESVVQWLEGLANFYRDNTGELVGIGDVSHILGEAMTDHASHQNGTDVDLYGLQAPPAGRVFPQSAWATTHQTEVRFTPLVAPDANARRPEYGVPRGAHLTGAAADEVRRLWLVIMAYCAATHGQLRAVVWEGAHRLRADAVALAQQIWDATVTARTGGTRPGWRNRWGPGPADRGAIQAPAGKFIGDGSGSYGTGRGWPPHQDHIHVRFD